MQMNEYKDQKKIKSILFRIQGRIVDDVLWHLVTEAGLGRIQLLALKCFQKNCRLIGSVDGRSFQWLRTKRFKCFLVDHMSFSQVNLIQIELSLAKLQWFLLKELTLKSVSITYAMHFWKKNEIETTLKRVNMTSRELDRGRPGWRSRAKLGPSRNVSSACMRLISLLLVHSEQCFQSHILY